LRELRISDAAAWHACVSDPRVHGPTGWPLLSVEEFAALLRKYVERGTRWAIARTSDDALVGTCGAVRWNEPVGVAEVAYELAPEAWGRGVATAAVTAFVEEARRCRIARVEAHTWVENAPSEHVLERCGFVREARFPKFRDCRGEQRDYWRWARSLDDCDARL
jgi:[ribosomal protein S5]-alanine N-acetyltransferase